MREQNPFERVEEVFPKCTSALALPMVLHIFGEMGARGVLTCRSRTFPFDYIVDNMGDCKDKLLTVLLYDLNYNCVVINPETVETVRPVSSECGVYTFELGFANPVFGEDEDEEDAPAILSLYVRAGKPDLCRPPEQRAEFAVGLNAMHMQTKNIDGLGCFMRNFGYFCDMTGNGCPGQAKVYVDCWFDEDEYNIFGVCADRIECENDRLLLEMDGETLTVSGRDIEAVVPWHRWDNCNYVFRLLTYGIGRGFMDIVLSSDPVNEEPVEDSKPDEDRKSA